MRSTLLLVMFCLSVEVHARPRQPKTAGRPKAPPSVGFYVHVLPVRDLSGGKLAKMAAPARALLESKVRALNVTLAPTGETKTQAEDVVRTKRLTGYQLELSLAVPPNGGVRGSLLVMTYPGGALRGAWSVQASGATTEELVEVVVPQVVKDALGDMHVDTDDALTSR